MPDVGERVREVFKRWDTRGTGSIPRAQLEKLITLLSNVQPLDVKYTGMILDGFTDSESNIVRYEDFISFVFRGVESQEAPALPPRAPSFMACDTAPLPLAAVAARAVAADVAAEAAEDEAYPSFGMGGSAMDFVEEAPAVGARESLTPRRRREESELLGVCLTQLQGVFLQEVRDAFGEDADPDYYAIRDRLLRGPEGRGFGKTCPRDGKLHCSYVDALAGDECAADQATVMLSWCWEYTAKTVVNSLARWCQNRCMEPPDVFVWQCALCCNQYRLEEAETFEDFQAVFNRRLTDIGHVLVLLSPWPRPRCLDRMWCLFEMQTAISTRDCRLEILLPEAQAAVLEEQLEAGTLPELWQAFGEVDFAAAKATFEQDRGHILRSVAANRAVHGATDSAEFDSLIIRRLQSWFVDYAVGVVVARLVRQEPFNTLQAGVGAARLLMDTAQWRRASDVVTDFLKQPWREGLAGSVEHGMLLQQLAVCLGKQNPLDGTVEARFAEAGQIFEALGAASRVAAAGLSTATASWRQERGEHAEAADLQKRALDTFTAAGVSVERPTLAFATLLHGMALCALQPEAGGADDARASAAADLFSQAERCFEALGASKSHPCATTLAEHGFWLSSKGNSAQAGELLKRAKVAYTAAGCTKRPEYKRVTAALAAFGEGNS